MQTFIGRSGFAFLEEREHRLTRRWFHYSPPETYSHMFRSPDWLLWKAGDLEAAVRCMDERTRAFKVASDPDTARESSRESERAALWARNGVRVTRLQVVDAASLAEPDSPLNYLLTYLALTHPGEDRAVIDGDACAQMGIDLPEIDFLIHDEDLVMTKYEGEPGVMYRDLYRNRPPAHPDEDDDRPVYRWYAEAAEELLNRREHLTYTGPLSGLALMERLDLQGQLDSKDRRDPK